MAFTPGSEKEIRKPVYLNTSYSFEERAADLVSRMTLEEKQSLLGNSMAAVPRLGINAYNVWGEALHGYASYFNPEAGPATSFPNSVAVGASWDPDLVQREASAIADEARGFNYPVINGLTYWSPVVEAMRDPRWGRTGESYGEDPFLISQIAGGFIRGLMGDDKRYLKAVPTGKHYFANNSEFNRHVSSSNMDDRDMREFYLAPYKKLIEKDNLPSIMTCYNAVNGIPVTANKFLVDTIARKTYGMKGYVTGDCGAVGDIQTGHFYVKTNAEAAAMGLKAGVDTDCGDVYQTAVIDAIRQGLITEADIDLALVNMFTVRMRIGEFDPKVMVPYAHIGKEVINSPGNVALAEEVATRTPVLLKNNAVPNTGRKALPLKPGEIKKIAVLGPQADKVELGPYSGRTLPENMITPLAGIRKFLKDLNSSVEVVHSSGANTISTGNLFNVFWFEIVKNDGKTVRYDANKFDSASKGIISSAGMTPEKSVKNIKDGDWTSYSNIDLTGAGKFNVGLTVPGDGGTVEVRLDSEKGKLMAVIEVKSGQGITSSFQVRTFTSENKLPEVSGKQNIYLVYRAPDETRAPAGKEAIELAASADVALVFVGTDDRTANEEADRLNLTLPGNQYELIKAVAEVNPYTVVVMQTLGMVEVEQFKNLPNVAGIIWTGFNGQAQGTAMAKILFGDVNPGGKLNATWFKSLADIAEITDYTLRGGQGKNGRTYWYFNKDVSYEFGYGLSYTTFEYSNFEISSKNITPNDKIKISVDVKNTGECDGDEVVQVYVSTPDSPASLQRPIKRLKGFQRVTIPAGQTRTVTIPIDCADLWFWDPDKD
ncbi:MAG: glycoside hydrolase family 3 C-terminal domain-containing protein, partial [Bacteroidales bacterium]|nr:glycoside hydrolase family 3 C-terminal domain-containing protein [Bacteroidales bacterium]